MAVLSNPSSDGVSATRFSAVRFLLRFVAVVAIPIIVLGALLWWLVGNDRVQRTIELQAAQNHRIVEFALGDGLTVEGDPGVRPALVVVPDPVRLTTARAAVLEPLLGTHRLRIVDPSGAVLYSDVASEVGTTIRLDAADLRALSGVPTGVQVPQDGSAVTYTLPWAPPGRATVALVQLTVADDVSVSATVADVADLGFLFGGAFLGLLIALGPMCWWALGQIRRQFRRTRVMALNDALTGLANRMQFHDRLDEAIAAAQRGNGRVGLIMVDLDGFKAINDTGGHAAGDRLLKRVAAGLREATRRNEIPCRLGGDEFAVVVPRLGSREELVALADRLHESLDLDVPFSDGRSLRVTASMGLAVFPEDAHDVDEIVNVADVAMYGVKAARKAKLPPRSTRSFSAR